MVRRFTTKGIRWPAKKKPVWVNIPFGVVPYSETVGRQLLLVPEDWEASFTGLTNERAVLKAIVGEVHFVQTVAGTSGGTMFWGIYAAGIDKAVPVFTTTGMSDVSWLVTGSCPTVTTVTQTLVASRQLVIPIRIKAKRKLDTNLQISICAQFGSDAAAPAGFFGGLLRFLVTRD